MSDGFRVCLLSNGRGEDRCAAQIAAHLSELIPDSKLYGAPLVTEGRDYTMNGIELVTRGICVPSGGFAFTSLAGFLKDMPYSPGYLRYFVQLCRARSRTDWALVVGDITLLLLGRAGLRKPIVYLALAKSDYKGKHHGCEIEAMRRYAHTILTRDEATASSLREHGLPAFYLGNPMMDGLSTASPSHQPGNVLGLLPGSRQEAYGNIKRILAVMERIPQKVSGICAMPSCLDVERFRRSARSVGWTCTEDKLTRNGIEVRLVIDGFNEAIVNSRVIIGMAGTANEQAAGLGKPVVSMPGCGPQTTPRRMRKQEKLMGGAIRFIRDVPNGVAEDVSYLLSNPEEVERRGRIGMMRMGPSGASERIAKYLCQTFVPDFAATELSNAGQRTGLDKQTSMLVKASGRLPIGSQQDSDADLRGGVT